MKRKILLLIGGLVSLGLLLVGFIPSLSYWESMIFLTFSISVFMSMVCVVLLLKQHSEAESLKVGDKVSLSGGYEGEVTNILEEEPFVEVKIRVSKYRLHIKK
jgi:preprotein translocase subunit YajC